MKEAEWRNEGRREEEPFVALILIPSMVGEQYLMVSN